MRKKDVSAVTPSFLDHVLRRQEVGGEFDFEYESFEGSFKLSRGISLNRVGWMYRFKAWKRGKSLRNTFVSCLSTGGLKFFD